VFDKCVQICGEYVVAVPRMRRLPEPATVIGQGAVAGVDEGANLVLSGAIG